MSDKKYLDYTGLQDVAGNVNTRLKTVTTMPAAVSDGAVRLYVGETSESYTKGHIYQYTPFYEWRYSRAHIYTKSATPAAGDAVYDSDGAQIGTVASVSTNEIEVNGTTYTSSGSTSSTWVDISSTIDPSLYATTFTGTQAEWDALTNKSDYTIVNITDDIAEGGAVVVDEVTSGNFNAVTSNAVYNAMYNSRYKITYYYNADTPHSNTQDYKNGLLAALNYYNIPNIQNPYIFILRYEGGYYALFEIMNTGWSGLAKIILADDASFENGRYSFIYSGGRWVSE